MRGPNKFGRNKRQLIPAVIVSTALLSAILSLGLYTVPAHAGFGDCADPSYRAQFDPRLEAVAYDCVERLRIGVPTEEGESEIRLVHDRNAGWALFPGVVDDFERGVRAAAEALDQIGPFRMDDVTVLLIDDLSPREGPSHTFSNIAALTGASASECRIGIYLLSPGGVTGNAAYVVAHEIFHCVQEATLSTAQMSSGSGGTGAGGDWWLEGSAEWFAALALPDPELISDRVARFDSISSDTPLYEMAYEAVVFFLWLNDEQGPGSILPFLRQMADHVGVSAQQSAMARALSAEEWLTFSESYLDRDIKHPHGSMLSVNPSEGDTWRWTETHTETVTLEPFVLHRGWIEFECGRWLPHIEPGQAHAVRSEEGAWGTMPDRIDTRAGDANRFRFAGFVARNRELRLRITGELEAGCSSCGDLDVVDACLIGTWKQSGGGPIGWMRRELQGIEIPRGERRNVVRVFESDGTFWTAQLDAELQFLAKDGSKGEGSARAQTAGRWSAEEGRLNLCQDRLAFGGQVTMTYPDGQTLTGIIPTPSAPDVVTMDYTCLETTLETRLSIPGVSTPMETQYRRIGGPPEGFEGGVPR